MVVSASKNADLQRVGNALEFERNFHVLQASNLTESGGS